MSSYKIIADKTWTIYVLRCRMDKFYVGKTRKDPQVRLMEHRTNPVAWTKQYPPVEIVDTYTQASTWDEDKITKIYMNRYGIQNVRGGSYSTVRLSNEQVQLILQEQMSAQDLCFTCGQSGHFAAQCVFDNKGYTQKHVNTWRRWLCCFKG